MNPHRNGARCVCAWSLRIRRGCGMAVKVSAAVLAVLAFVLAPSAQADSASYIERLQRDGVPMLSGPVPAIQAGMTACQMLRDGAPFEYVAGNVAGLWSGIIGPRIVAAAQSELCPDTL